MVRHDHESWCPYVWSILFDSRRWQRGGSTRKIVSAGSRTVSGKTNHLLVVQRQLQEMSSILWCVIRHRLQLLDHHESSECPPISRSGRGRRQVFRGSCAKRCQ